MLRKQVFLAVNRLNSFEHFFRFVRHPEITDLEMGQRLEKDVRGFQIGVDNAFLMEVK